MNRLIRDIATQTDIWCDQNGAVKAAEWEEKFAELLKQAIYDKVKEELIEDEIINIESDRLSREYLKGCNGGIVDALCHIKNFGVDIDE